MKRFIDSTFGSMRNLLCIVAIVFAAIAAKMFGLEYGAPGVFMGMAALTGDKRLDYKEGVEVPVPVKTLTEIFAGSFVCVDATGWGVPGADTAGLIFHGVSRSYVPATSGNGAATAIVRRRGLVKTDLATAITQANVGDNVFLVDDQTVDLVGNVTNAIFCGTIAEYIDATHAYIDIEPAIIQGAVATHIADVSAAHAASAISITDAGGFTAQADVEGALQEMLPKAPVAIADPGNAGAIPVTRSGSVAITTTGAQTRTLAIPGRAGITLAISLDVDGGDCVITAAAAINQTGNNTITLNDAGDTIVLAAVQKAGALVWRVAANDGCTLSTV